MRYPTLDTARPRSFDPDFLVNYYLKWTKTFLKKAYKNWVSLHHKTYSVQKSVKKARLLNIEQVAEVTMSRAIEKSVSRTYWLVFQFLGLFL